MPGSCKRSANKYLYFSWGLPFIPLIYVYLLAETISQNNNILDSLISKIRNSNREGNDIYFSLMTLDRNTLKKNIRNPVFIFRNIFKIYRSAKQVFIRTKSVNRKIASSTDRTLKVL